MSWFVRGKSGRRATLIGLLAVVAVMLTLVSYSVTLYRLFCEATGAFGAIGGAVMFELAESAGRTTVRYEGQLTISGPLARLDSRFAEGFAGSLIGQGLRALGTRLRGQLRDQASAPQETRV